MPKRKHKEIVEGLTEDGKEDAAVNDASSPTKEQSNDPDTNESKRR
jgi:hypothetical protein